MIKLIPTVISVFIVGLFLYSKLTPYKDKLEPKYRKIFDLIDAIFNPIFVFSRKVIKPFQVGKGLSVDMNQLVLLVVFLILLNFF